MVTLDEFRAWDSRVLIATSDELMRRWRELAVVHGELTEDVVGDGWEGRAADAAHAALRRLRGTLFDTTTELLRIGICIAGAAVDMASLVAALDAVQREAARSRFDIGSDGSVSDAMESYSVAQQDVWTAMRDRRRCRTELAERIAQLIRSATEFDDDLARRLAAPPSAESVNTAPAVSVPQNVSPAANAAFWSALSTASRTRLLIDEPALIGNLDGLPARVRDAANRRVLAGERVRLRSEAARLQKELDDNVFGGLFSNADAGLEQTRRRLASLDAIDATLAQGDRQLLVLDNTSYQETLAAIAVGDVDTAEHVAVFVPGLGSSVDADMLRYDGAADGLEEAVQQLLPPDPPQSAAVITWMNYQAPQLDWSLLDPERTVASDASAQAGADRLVPFLEGLDASRSSDPHLSVLAHSYGSLTAAMALRGSTGVDEFVALGSPGLGTQNAGDLQLPSGHLFAAEAEGDLIADLAAFGRDPGTQDGVAQLSTDAHGDYTGSIGHSGYVDEGSTSQQNTALVVAGRGDDAVIRGRPGLMDLLQKILYL